ncbi:MAG: hypothetical protein OM95_13960 [Bdellovibrio sp. ArHS]|uniref:hypothetical protein n=1 Tax=Bdellovibrio sp. ArHS TaxID=1569284 RepID=UPI0005833B03|nr:hypothetical protein [Bdellovibrio sp. ArHS]KHD87543.1 MAG: hypothetical protein OM95_13960 [Bdellovibrio sp. ArHS]
MKWKSSEKIQIDLKPPGGQITCDFTDELESLSVKGYPVKVTYQVGAADTGLCAGKILDFVTENKKEFMIMSDGTRIVLSSILRITSA